MRQYKTKKIILAVFIISILTFPSVSFSECKTPLECYENALKHLQDARAEIKDIAARLANLEIKTEELEGNYDTLKVNYNDLQQSVLAHFNKRPFGDPSPRGFNTSYPAATDGFVTVSGYSTPAGYLLVSGLVGTSEGNLKRVAAEMIGGTHWRDNGSFTFFVKKGHYWKVDATVGTSALHPTSSVIWTPFEH